MLILLQDREQSLRGGGCGSSKIVSETTIPQQSILTPNKLVSHIRNHCELLKKYSITPTDEQQNIMNSIQFLQQNDINIYNLSESNQVNASIDVILISLELLLDAITTMIKSNVLQCYWLTEALSELCRVVFRFYALNGQRYMDIKKQQQYLVQVDKLQEQINIEAQNNPIRNNVEFELFKIKAILTITPTNSKEGQEILTQFIGGALKAGLTMTINDDLIESIGKGLIYIYNESQRREFIRKYEIMYFLDSTKYQILSILPTVTNAKDILNHLQKVYISSVSQSKDWEIQYCWLKMLFQIINYKVQILPDSLTDDQKRELEMNKLLISYDKGPSILNINYKILESTPTLLDLPVNIKLISQLQQLIIEGNDLVPSIDQQYMNLFKQEVISSKNNMIVKAKQSQYQASVLQSIAKLIQIIEQLQTKYDDNEAFITLHTELSMEFKQCTFYISDIQLTHIDNCLSIFIPYTLIKCIYMNFISQQVEQIQLLPIEFDNPDTIVKHGQYYTQSIAGIEKQLALIKQFQGALSMIIELIEYEIVIQENDSSTTNILYNPSVINQTIAFYNQLCQSEQQDKFNTVDFESLTINLRKYKQDYIKEQVINKDVELKDILHQKLELIEKILEYHITLAELKDNYENESTTIKLTINSCSTIIKLCNKANDLTINYDGQNNIQQAFIEDINHIKKNQILLQEQVQQIEMLKQFQQSQQSVLDQIRKQIFNYKQFHRFQTDADFNSELGELKQKINKQIDKYQSTFKEQPKIEFYLLLNESHKYIFKKYPVELIGQIIFITKQIGDEQINNNNSFIDEYKQLATDQINSQVWRGRQLITLKVLETQQQCLNVKSFQIISGILVKMQVFETDKRIRQLFKEPDYIQQLNKVMLENWENEEEKISNEISKSITNMNALLVQMAQEPDINKKQKLQKELQKLQSNINEQISNVQSISSSLGITVQFIQDVKKDVLRVENKINDIQNSINQVGTDIKYLKGKSVIELFQIRMHKIIQQQLYSNANKVYVPIKTKEKLIQHNREDEQSELFSDNLLGNGEINEFIWKQQKDSMLIHGSAGSGKSTAALRIEEFIWGIYQKNMGTHDYIPIIPVFVILPSLKDPLYNAIDETLKSDNYRFDERQVLQLKEDVESNKIRLIFILDSYDELQSAYIGQNILLTNRISKWRSKKDINTFPKVITTTRNEIFNVQNYWSWFISESNNLKYFKEIRLLKFDESQIDDYIEQYCRLTLKQLIIEVYEESSQIENQTYLKQFEQLTSEILNMLMGQKQQLEKLTKDHVDKIVQYLRKCTIINEPIQEEPLKLLRIKLIQLWGYKEYKDLVVQLKLMSILETPFMIEIVLQVLPKISSQRNDMSFVKDNFITRYMKSNTQLSQDQIQIAALTEFQLLEQSNVFNDYQITMNKWQINKTIKQYLPNAANLQLIADALIVNNLTQYDIYLEFLTQYFERQLQKQKALGINIDLQSTLDELWIFAQNLALEMASKQLTYIEYQPKGLIYKDDTPNWKNQFFNDDCIEGVYKKMFRNCIPLTQKQKFYSFMHKSIQEFLVAKRIVDQLILGNMSLISSQQLGQEFGITQFIVNKLDQNIEVQNQLFNSVKNCNVVGASNILYLLNCMNYSFVDKDLTGLEIENITLQQSNFYNCQLTNTKWTNVNISSCNFSQANLTGIVWKGIYLNELPQLNHHQSISVQLEYLHKTATLLSLGRDDNLQGYNTQHGKSQLLLNNVQRIAVSLDEQYLVGLNPQNIILYNLDEGKQIISYDYAKFIQLSLNLILFSSDVNILIMAGSSGVYLIELKDILNNSTSDPFVQITDEYATNILHINNQVIIIYNQARTSVYDIIKREMSQEPEYHTIFNQILVAAASSEYLAVAGRSNQIEILLLNTSMHKDTLFSHKGDIKALKFQNIETLVSASLDCTIKLWNVKTSILIITINFPQVYYVTTITLAKPGIIVAGTRQQSILQWDSQMQGQQKKDCKKRQGHTSTVKSVAFSVDGTLLASGSDSGIIKLWETQRSVQLGIDIKQGEVSILCLCFNHDSSILFSGGTDCQLVGRDLINYDIIYQIDGYGVALCEIYRLNQNLVCRLSDETVRIYDLNLKQFKLVFNYKNEADQLSLGYQDSITNYAQESNQKRKYYNDYLQNNEITCFDIGLFGTQVICHKGGQIQLINSPYKYEINSQVNSTPIVFVKLVDRDTFLTWKQGSFIVWRLNEILYTLLGSYNKANAIGSLKYQGKWYYLSCDYCINIWLPQHSEVQQWKVLMKSSDEQIHSMESYDQQIVGGSEFGTIFIWNIVQGQLIKEIKNAHAGSINAITINLQQKWLVSTDTQSEVKFWDYTVNERHTTLQTTQFNIIFVYMDQLILITGTNTEIIIWNSETNQQLNTIYLNNRSKHHIVYIPTYLTLYVSELGCINMFPLSINAYISNTMYGTQHDPNCLAVSDKLIATGGVNGSIYIWDYNGIRQGEGIISQPTQVDCLSIDDQILVAYYKFSSIKVFNLSNKEIMWQSQASLSTQIITFSLLLQGGFVMYYNASEQNLVIINVNDKTQQIINTKLKQLKGVVSRNNQYIATIGDDKYIRMYSQTTKGWGCSKMISLEPQMMCEGALIKDAQVISHSGMDLIELFRERNAIYQ